jgi:predicted hydrolase (HD superfamily)
MDVDEAAELARTMLAEALPRRWKHVRSVARRARWVAKELSLSDDLVAAAWLHDIGYAPELVESGFHPLDGARYLRRQGVDAQIVNLVAHHSCAYIEADGWRPRSGVNERTGVGSLQDRQVFEGRTHARACPSIAH